MADRGNEAGGQQSRIASPAKRGAVVALATALLGPAVGALPFLTLAVVSDLLSGPSLDARPLPSISNVFGAAAGLMLFGYIFGGLQAMVSGIWLGIRTWKTGSVSFSEAMFTALVVSLLAVALATGLEMTVGGGEPRSLVAFGALLASFSMFAAAILYGLMRWLRVLPRKAGS